MPSNKLGMMGAAGAGGSALGSYTAFLWGKNNSGQLGDGTVILRSSPVQLGDDGEWAAISMGGEMSAGVKSDGSLWTWGQNTTGGLGQNDTVDRSVPTQVGALSDWATIHATNHNVCFAIKSDGTLWSWGDDRSFGVLGQGDVIDRSSPTQVGSDTDWVRVDSTQNNALAIKTDGTLWAWGRNTWGNVGDGTVIHRSSPVQISAETNWVDIAVGAQTQGAVKSNGTLWTWGFGSSGRNGQGDTVSRSVPTQLGSLTTWKYIFDQGTAMHAIKTDGTLWSWGNGANGKLADGTVVTQSSPIQVGSLTNWLHPGSIATGVSAAPAVVIKADGSMWSWGYNGNGALGLGDVINRSSPVQIGSETYWIKAMAAYSSAALK